MNKLSQFPHAFLYGLVWCVILTTAFLAAPGLASAAGDDASMVVRRDRDFSVPMLPGRTSDRCDKDDDDCEGTTPEHPGGSDPTGEQPPSGGEGPTGPGGGDGDHSGLTWKGPGTCLECHEVEAQEMHASVHYQWEGDALDMVSGPSRQGKNAGGVNSYCINITGNWTGCSNCHVGRGALPDPSSTQAQLENIDCLICHQSQYKRVRVNGVFVPDVANMSITMDQAVQTVHEPNRATCVQCHAKGGGGDNFKRGDMTLAHAATTDESFDVHMATTGANLSCQECHATDNHLMAGRGSDLRVTENLEEIGCSTSECHTSMASGGHESRTIDRHVARVACQVCHIPLYARNAADTAATEATEIHRTWLEGHQTASGAIHPANVMANNLLPAYRFWNGTSYAYNLGEKATLDRATGRYPTSRPVGSIDDRGSKLFPFKYKTAEQPLATNLGMLIAVDTSVFFATGDAAAATEQGLENMGYSPAEPYKWIETDTFQLLTHEVAPDSSALSCASCHEETTRMDLMGELGYALKGPRSTVCTQCHGQEDEEEEEDGESGYRWIHDEHVNEKHFDCSWCHGFSRPERDLKMP